MAVLEFPVIKRSPWQVQCAVVFALMMREIKTRFGGRWTGVFWLIGTPLSQMAMMAFINNVLRGRLSRGSYEFIPFLIVALMPYMLFRRLWGQLMSSVGANRGLFGFRQVKPLDTMISRTIVEGTLHVLMLVLTLLFLGRIGFYPVVPVDPLMYTYVTFLFLMLGAGLGLMSAVIIDVLPKFDVLVSLISLPLYFISGILFSVDNFPPQLLVYFLYNPVMHLAELARMAFLPGYIPVAGINFTYPTEVIVLIWGLAMTMYSVRRQKLIAHD